MYRYYLALRFIASRPINLLGIGGVMLGVWALIVVVSIFSGYIREVKEHVNTVSADMVIVNLGNGVKFAVAQGILEADQNVAACSPRLVWGGLLHPNVEKGGPTTPIPGALPKNGPYVTIVGIDPALEIATTGFGRWLEAVTDPALQVAQDTLQETRNWVLLSPLRAAKMQLARGDSVPLTMARLQQTWDGGMTQFGRLDPQLVGCFSTDHAGFDTLTVYLHIEALRSLIAKGNPDFTNEIAIKLRDGSPTATEQTRRRIEGALFSHPDFQYPQPLVKIAGEQEQGLLNAVDHQRGLMKLVLFVIMVVAGFLVYATLSMMVTEKIHDIGVLSALGATRRGVLQVFMTCGLAIALSGTLCGIVSGCITSIYLDPFNAWLKQTWDIDLFPIDIYNLPHVPYHLDPWWILIVGSSSLLLGLIAAAIPALRAMRNDPLDALRNG
ncbi:MAG: FtsX-like permease family protein [Planctomycetota bacterium]|nr:FtsX-like permease family protein [Planctomycetota bacterium]